MATPEATHADCIDSLAVLTPDPSHSSPHPSLLPPLPLRVLVLFDAPLLAWSIQTCLAGFAGLSVSLQSCTEQETGLGLAEKRPDLVIAVMLRPQPGLCRQLRTAEQRGWVRSLVCLPHSTVDCHSVPSPDGLPLAVATPIELRAHLRRVLTQLAGDSTADAPRTAPLTERELEIGELVVRGLSSHEIGKLLFISPRTVEKHRANIMEKLGVSNAAALTLELIYMGWEELLSRTPSPDVPAASSPVTLPARREPVFCAA